eukprot:3654825-Amphidinium_carterae.1
MQALSHQITRVHDRLDSVMLRGGAEDIVVKPTGIITPPTRPSIQPMMVRMDSRSTHPLVQMLRGVKPMPPPPPVRLNRSSPY